MTKSTGTVTMELEAYNEMVRRLDRLENAIRVAPGYDNEPELKVNLGAYEGNILEQLKDYPDFELRKRELYYQTIGYMFNRIEKPEEVDHE